MTAGAGSGVEWDKAAARKFIRKRVGALMEGIGVAVESQAVSLLSVDQAFRRTEAGRNLGKGRLSTGGRMVAETDATPGAPPRVLTGRLRQSVDHETKKTKSKIVSRVGTNVKYGVVHEEGTHPWLMPALRASKNDIRRIIKRIGARR